MLAALALATFSPIMAHGYMVEKLPTTSLVQWTQAEMLVDPPTALTTPTHQTTYGYLDEQIGNLWVQVGWSQVGAHSAIHPFYAVFNGPNMVQLHFLPETVTQGSTMLLAISQDFGTPNWHLWATINGQVHLVTTLQISHNQSQYANESDVETEVYDGQNVPLVEQAQFVLGGHGYQYAPSAQLTIGLPL
jgi:hypothetical protein